jgi:hypothetical protein
MPSYLIDRQTPIQSDSWGDDEPDPRALNCILVEFAKQGAALAAKPDKAAGDERRGWCSAVHVILAAHDIAGGPAPFSVWLDVIAAEQATIAQHGPMPSQTQPTRPSWFAMFAQRIVGIWTERVVGNAFDPTTPS